MDFALRIHGYDRKKRKKRTEECLDYVGLKRRMKHRPYELSGGEQQRVAIALANNPRIILADEPTGSVDGKTAIKIMEVFNRLCSELGVTVLLVTHDIKLSRMVERVVEISDGIIGSEMVRKEDYVKRLSEMSSNEETHNEYVVVDKKGRIKIPEELISDMKISGGERLKIQKSRDGFMVNKL